MNVFTEWRLIKQWRQRGVLCVYSLLHTKFHKWKSLAQNSVYFRICFTARAHHRLIKFFHNAPFCSFLRHMHMVLGISNPCTLSVYSHPLTSRKTGGWCLSLFFTDVFKDMWFFSYWYNDCSLFNPVTNKSFMWQFCSISGPYKQQKGLGQFGLLRT